MPPLKGFSKQNQLTSKDQSTNSNISHPSPNNGDIERLQNFIDLIPSCSRPNTYNGLVRTQVFREPNLVQSSQVNNYPAIRVTRAAGDAVAARSDRKLTLVGLDDLKAR